MRVVSIYPSDLGQNIHKNIKLNLWKVERDILAVDNMKIVCHAGEDRVKYSKTPRKGEWVDLDCRLLYHLLFPRPLMNCKAKPLSRHYQEVLKVLTILTENKENVIWFRTKEQVRPWGHIVFSPNHKSYIFQALFILLPTFSRCLFFYLPLLVPLCFAQMSRHTSFSRHPTITPSTSQTLTHT